METCNGGRAVVLVVDDDEDVREAITEVLALDGHIVIAVENGEQAIGALAAVTPNLLVTDLSMPVLDGPALIARVRSCDQTRRIPVCVVSANMERVPQGIVAVKKPFGVMALRETVRSVLACAASGLQ